MQLHDNQEEKKELNQVLIRLKISHKEKKETIIHLGLKKSIGSIFL
jgi:hypothetical protein